MCEGPDETVCYICHCPTVECCPCLCSNLYCHTDCLHRWILSKTNEENFGSHWLKCGICKGTIHSKFYVVQTFLIHGILFCKTFITLTVFLPTILINDTHKHQTNSILSFVILLCFFFSCVRQCFDAYLQKKFCLKM